MDHQESKLRAGPRSGLPAGEPGVGGGHPTPGTIVHKTTETPPPPPPPPAGYATRAELDRRLDAMLTAIKRALERLIADEQRALDARDAKIAELDRRITELDARPAKGRGHAR